MTAASVNTSVLYVMYAEYLRLLRNTEKRLDLPVIKQTDNLLETSVFNVPQVRCYFTIQDIGRKRTM